MINRKFLLLFLTLGVIFVIGVAIRNNTFISPTSTTSSSPPLNEQQRILKRIHKSMATSPHNKKLITQLNDFHLSSKELLAQHSVKILQQTIEQEVKILTKCLKADFCGMQVNKEKGYFDEAEVGGAKNLRHILTQFETLVDQQQIDAHSIDLPFADLFALPNMENKILAAKLFLAKDNSLEQIKKLLKYETNFTAQSRGKLYALLFDKVPPASSFHAQLITNLLTSIRNRDSYMVLTILEESKNFKLTEDELFELIKESCRFKETPEERHNWNMVKLALQETIAAVHANLSVEQICH